MGDNPIVFKPTAEVKRITSQTNRLTAQDRERLIFLPGNNNELNKAFLPTLYGYSY
jgi:hypothetical protein